MQPSKSKSRTIMSFFSPSSPKKQRLINQELHHSSTSTEASTELVLSQETHLHRLDASTNLHDSATAIHNKSISTSLISNTSSLAQNLLTQSFAIIPIAISSPLIDPPSPLLSTSLLSPIVIPIDVNSASVSPSSQPTSPSVSQTTSSRSVDITL
ncbi:unnamed protein product [Rotaria magnacalcarata]|uniref:Uncharacterized protein n=2 Tax=Rotaria magnacalcarata TaxID=392030 RepID=A0A815F3L3_9BILA|nr:unnamed protein product [Rotaria magnacalcarata]CAF1320813.1 unnamed protein product [Rotaria magnacalcarata]CAF2038672.1 unnamed protein product [Rotaria magnacalcarata]CAF2099147.1 unnamed protein product [Rotaria magnacalcarata]CAF4518388.1 unnamed protein product [Rotaria magnacalcarata]